MLIAEVGLTHCGCLGTALAFIDAVADAGATAVKFQCHDGDPSCEMPQSGCVLFQDADRQAYWKRTAFTRQQWEMLSNYARSRCLKFGVTPFSVQALDTVADLCDFIKISRNHVNTSLHCAATETHKRSIYTGHGGLGLNKYDPATERHIGISDHSGTIWPCLKAAAMGAEIFEVHVCWDRRQWGPDILYSITIDELAQLAKAVR